MNIRIAHLIIIALLIQTCCTRVDAGVVQCVRHMAGWRDTSCMTFAEEAGNDPLMIARQYIRTHMEDWGLSPEDTAGMTVNAVYTDEFSGITRVYFQQHYQGIPVHNAILNVNITRDGDVFFAGNRFEPRLSERIDRITPVLTAEDAVMKLAKHHALTFLPLRLKSRAGNIRIYDKGSIAHEDIKVELCYQPLHDNIYLAWAVLLAPVQSLDKWSCRIDAMTGAVLSESNWTFYCSANNTLAHDETQCGEFAESTPQPSQSVSSAEYHVWPAPVESPNHGSRAIVTDPHDPEASPYGWHDVNGQPGAEYTITRGNNVHVYQDRDDLGYSSGDEPNGGPDLHFDFPFDASWEPVQCLDAATVNVFYWINTLHDISYHFGFDEAAGNFQKNNYGRGGVGNDFLYAVVQNGANTGHANNAIYRHNDEGTSSNIRILEFRSRLKYLTVTAPDAVVGNYDTSIPAAGWGVGAYVSEEPVSGEVVVINDGIENPMTSDGCEDVLNASELEGRVALIERGGCPFAFKALQAQNAGAIAVIICNYDEDAYSMLPGPDGPEVHIPVVLINASACKTLRLYAGDDLQVTLVKQEQTGPMARDGGLDNSILAHEFAHGISCRLAGGPSKMCLENAEQMQEGWSDFFALAMTVQPGDTGERKRGFGAYALSEPATANGYRRYPYSTDMRVMPLTYGDVAPNQETHALGEVWGCMLWDMYWALVDMHGWSADHRDTSSGNYMAIRLVFDGLKNLPCSPGFVDARDAILAADQVLYHGSHYCLLWNVFARRGLGFSADQGSSFDAGDQKEAFDVPPACAQKILLDKSVTDFIIPGQDIEVNIRVRNFKPEQTTNVVVVDEIPEGTIFKTQSSNIPAVLQDNLISFSLGEMDFSEEITISYTLSTDPEIWSRQKFLDDVNDDRGDNWLSYTIAYDAPNHWNITDDYPTHSGNFVWTTKEIQGKSRQALELNPEAYTFLVEGNHPVLRFYHRYQTKAGTNGGVVEVREVGSIGWSQVSDDMIRHGYTGILNYEALASTNLRAFSGDSGDQYLATYVDLSKWAGKEIQIRFRFGTTASTSDGIGWMIDDIEFMDMVSYNGEVCLSTYQGDDICTKAPFAGTIVESQPEKLSATPVLPNLSVTIYPNPASDVLTLALSGTDRQDLTVSLYTMDGRQIFSDSTTIQGDENLHIGLEHIPSGIYGIKINTAEGQISEKIIVQD